MAQSDRGQLTGSFPPIIQSGAIVFVVLFLASLLVSVLPTIAGTIGDQAVVSQYDRLDILMNNYRFHRNIMATYAIGLAPVLVSVFGVVGAGFVGVTTEGRPGPVALSVATGILLGGVLFVMVVTGLASEQFRTASDPFFELDLWYKPVNALKMGLAASIPTALGGGAIAGTIRLLRS